MFTFIKIKNLKYFFFKLKIIVALISLHFYGLEKNLLIYNSYKPKNNTLEEEIEYKNFLNLKEKPLNNNDSLVIEEKQNILNSMSKTIGKDIKTVDKIFYSCNCKFGNLLVILNKMLFFNEIIGLNHIILDKDIFWFIKNKIYIEKYNITIEVDDIIKYNNSLSSNIIYNCELYFYSFFKLKPEIRINYLRDEILRNLPEITISANDLYIHIRSGDIFSYLPHYPYSQPPLCFYKKILNEYKFEKIFIISQGKNNPVIRRLLNLNKNIIYKKNPLEYDIAYLIHAYNMVGSVSSFSNSIIQLNYNLKNLWDYNIYRVSEKVRQLHYDFYKFPFTNFTIYRMEASPFYKDIMYIWKNNKKQRNLMIIEKCINNFTIINK